MQFSDSTFGVVITLLQSLAIWGLYHWLVLRLDQKAREKDESDRGS